jgi:hypothetical protein
MIDRPLVFGNVPSIMVSRDHVSRFLEFFKNRSVYFEACSCSFQQNFHLVKFPALENEDVEDLLDQLSRAQA